MGDKTSRNGPYKMDTLGVSNENPNESTPAIEPARDQIRPDQQNGDVESGGSSVAIINGIPKMESVQEAVAKAVEDNTLFPPNMNSNKSIEEFGAQSTSTSCQSPSCFKGCLKKIRHEMEQAKKGKFGCCTYAFVRWLVYKLVQFLLFLGTKVFFPVYDVVTDYKEAVKYFKDDDSFWYGMATLLFVFIPVFLTLTLGKGWKDLREAWTLKKFKQRNRDKIKSDHPGWSDWEIDNDFRCNYVRSTCKRITIFIQTLLGFVPGLCWFPPSEEVTESNDSSHGQTLLARKIFVFCGEDIPQFILQAAIVMSTPNITISGLCWAIFDPNGPILSSLLGLISNSTTVYLEYRQIDKYGQYFEPYTTWKNQLIATPMMIITVVPRVLTLTVFFAASFPLFPNYAKEGIRSGLIMFICTFILYVLSFAIGSRVKSFPAKKRVLSCLSALISPCLIVDQTSGIFLWASCLSSVMHFILLVGLALTLELNPLMWNSSLANSENFGSSKELYTQLVYVLLPWLFLSIFGSFFLVKFGNIDGRYEIKKKIGFGSDGSFVDVCKDKHAPVVESMLKLYDGSFLNQTEKLEIDEWTKGKHEYTGLHLACYSNDPKVVQLLVENPNININVETSSGDNAFTYGIWHDDNVVAKMLLESGKLNIKGMKGVYNYVPKAEDGFQFEHHGYYGKFLVIMNSPKSFQSKTRMRDY